MRTLVTGAAGFVGANLVRRLLRDSHEVHAVCRPGGDHSRLRNLDGIALHEADLTARGTVGALLSEVSPDWIFPSRRARRLFVAGRRTADLRGEPLRHDRAGRRRRAPQGTGIRSRGILIGVRLQGPPGEEDERPDPNSTYAVAKAAATMYCGHRAHEGKLAAVTLRLYSVYGALEDPRLVVAKLLAEGLQGCLPPLVSPDTARDFVYVEDVCDAFVLAALRAADLAGGVYNIGSGRETSIGELIDVFERCSTSPKRPAGVRTHRESGTPISGVPVRRRPRGS